MKFEEYVDKFYKEYEPKCEVDKDKHEEFEKWYANYQLSSFIECSKKKLVLS